MNRFSVPAVLFNGNCKNILARLEQEQICNVPVNENLWEQKALCGKAYEKLSGYDVLLENKELSGRNFFERRIFDIALERIYALQKTRMASFFRPSNSLNEIVYLLQEEFGDTFRHISLEISPWVKGACGGEADFVLISALVLAFCSRYGRGDISSNLSISKGEINFCVSTSLNHNENIGLITENEAHWMHIINLLSEGNLWRFDWGINENILEFRLNMFEYREDSEFILRDSKFPKEHLLSLGRAVTLAISKRE